MTTLDTTIFSPPDKTMKNTIPINWKPHEQITAVKIPWREHHNLPTIKEKKEEDYQLCLEDLMNASLWALKKLKENLRQDKPC